MTAKQFAALRDYMAGMKYKDIAKKYGVSINTVRSWKTRLNWKRSTSKKSAHTKNKKDARKSKKVVHTNDLDISAKKEIFCQLVGSERIPLYKAYQIAFQSKKRIKVNTAMSQGSLLAKDPAVKARINEIAKDLAIKYKWSTDRVIQSLTFVHDQAKADIIQWGITKSNSEAMLNSLDQITNILGLNKLSAAQANKAMAEAKIAESQAKAIENSENTQHETIIVDNLSEVTTDGNNNGSKKGSKPKKRS